MTLLRWSRGRSTPARLVLRAQIVLRAAAGGENRAIAGELGVSRPTVGLWRQRFARHGLRGIEKDAPRGGRPSRKRKSVEKQIVEATTQTKPAHATDAGDHDRDELRRQRHGDLAHRVKFVMIGGKIARRD